MGKKAQRAAKILRQQELVNTAKTANRSLNGEEQAEFDALQREIESLTLEIEQGEDNSGEPLSSGQVRQAEEPQNGSSSTPGQVGENPLQRDVDAERTRISDIVVMCRDFNIAPENEDKFIKESFTVDQVRAAILEQLRAHGAPVNTGISGTASGEDDFRRDAADGLLIRGGITVDKPSTGAQQMAHMGLRDLAIECLERADVSGARRMSSNELFTEIMQRQYYNPTAAFPTILDNTINKAYVEGHCTAPATFDLWTKKGTLKDFKEHDNYYLAGPIGDFEEVPEGGELKSDIPTDAKRPTRRLKTWGKQFTLSRQAFINDDIELVTRIPARHAAAARRTINTQCYQRLMGNKEIYDGKALFCKEHANLLKTGTGITRAAVQGMILALSTQKDEFDQAIIVRPGKIIVPAGLDFDIYTLFHSPYIHTEDNTQAVNPLYAYKDMQIIADPTINKLSGGFGNVMPWFMTANSTDSDFMEVDYLNGQEIPTIRRMETPGQLGFVWDIYLDWGINVMDYRGCVKNPGIKVENPLGVL